MTIKSQSRQAPTPPLPYPGSGAPAFEWAYPWNAERVAIGIDRTPEASLAQPETAAALPIVTRHLERMAARGYTEENEPNRILLDMMRQRAAIERATYEREQSAWQETPEGVEARFVEQPTFIRRQHENKIAWLRANRGERHTNAFLMGTVKNALLRLFAVKKQHTVSHGHHSEFTAYYRAIYSHLAEFSKRRVKTLANEIAGRVNEMFCTAIDDMGGDITTLPDAAMLFVYRNIAVEVLALRIMPPGWKKLRRQPGVPDEEREPLDRGLFASAMARLIRPEWWEHQLWRLRLDWRENQLRAMGSVHKRAMPYISKDALADWLEQRRKNREFFKSHELTDDEGNTASLEHMVDHSISNPAIRRHELMTRMKGLELTAQSRGDAGVFYTITCPSKYHATNQSGHHNPKWNHSDPKQAQRYLSRTWAKIGAKLGREGLRVYGFRVAEPHHDETPHWHLLLFMHPQERNAITSIMRSYAVKEDRAELGKRTSARFTAKRLDPKKGSATAYIAKYISKNIDGYALDGELDHETGKPLKDTARLAMAWASRHRIRQYQPIGTPPVTVWRELRKLANQLEGTLKQAGQFKRGQQMLIDPAMDAVMAAADAGCFATYIQKQGGVLIPRESYVVRIAYQDADKPNDYGEIPEKIFGVFSPRLGDLSRVCTRLKNWTITAKKKGKESEKPAAMPLGLTFQDGPAVPWSSVNNSTVEQKTSETGGEIDSHSEQIIIDFDRMTDKERREMVRRLRQQPASDRNRQQPMISADEQRAIEAAQRKAAHRDQQQQRLAARAALIADFAQSIGIDLPQEAALSLAAGATLEASGKAFRANHDGSLSIIRSRGVSTARELLRRVDNLWHAAQS